MKPMVSGISTLIFDHSEIVIAITKTVACIAPKSVKYFLQLLGGTGSLAVTLK